MTMKYISNPEFRSSGSFDNDKQCTCLKSANRHDNFSEKVQSFESYVVCNACQIVTAKQYKWK